MEEDSLVRNLKNRVDRMTVDHLIYLFVPEILDQRNRALKKADFEKADQYSEVLKYVGTKVSIDIYNIDDFDFIQNPELIVPTPHEIINQKSTKNIPNN